MEENYVHAPSWLNDHDILYGKIHKLICNIADKYENELSHDYLVDISCHCEWVTAFTHKTANEKNNSALMSISGSFLIQFMFLEYLHSRFGDKLTQRNTNLLIEKYTNSKYLILIANRLGLMEFVNRDLFAIKRDDDIIMKSFIYCLHCICETKSLYGGYTWCFHLIKWLFDDVDIDIDDLQMNYISQLRNLYNKNGWGTPNYVSRQTRNGWVVEIKKDNKTLSSYFAVSKKDANMGASKNALYNITRKNNY